MLWSGGQLRKGTLIFERERHTPHATRHQTQPELWGWTATTCEYETEIEPSGVSVASNAHTHTPKRASPVQCSINVYYFWLCTVGVVSLTASMWSGWTPTVRRQHPHASAWKSVIHPGASCSTHSDLTRCKHTHTHQNTRARTWRRHSTDDKVIEHFTNMLRLFVCRYEILPLPPQRW